MWSRHNHPQSWQPHAASALPQYSWSAYTIPYPYSASQPIVYDSTSRLDVSGHGLAGDEGPESDKPTPNGLHSSTLSGNHRKLSDPKRYGRRHQIWNSFQKIVAETLGCFVFVFIGSMSGQTKYGPFSASFAHGFCIALLIIGLGHVSGGHFNPAVTIGVFISGNIHIALATLYIMGQLIGGFIGALFVRVCLNQYEYVTIAGGTTNMNAEAITVAQAIITETILTYVLVHTVLNAAVDSEGTNALAPLGIGLAVLVDIIAGGASSGASMNPARSFGPAAAYALFYNGSFCSSNDCITPYNVWNYHFVHWVGPVLGGIVAGIFYKLFFAKDGKRWLMN